MLSPRLSDHIPDASNWRSARCGRVLVLVLVVMFAVAGCMPFGGGSFNGIDMESTEPLPDFELQSSTGGRVSLSDYRGRHVLIYFGYTFCPDVCPTTLNEVKKAYQSLGDAAADVQVVMVSVDPERDTPEALAEYLAYFDPSFVGLTGSIEEISAAATPFGVYFAKDPGSAVTGYLVSHTASLFLVDPEGYLKLVYSYGTPADEIAEDLRRLQ